MPVLLYRACPRSKVSFFGDCSVPVNYQRRIYLPTITESERFDGTTMAQSLPVETTVLPNKGTVEIAADVEQRRPGHIVSTMHHILQSELETIISRRLSVEVNEGPQSEEMLPEGSFYDSTGNCTGTSTDGKDCQPVHLIVARKPPNPNKLNPDLRELQRELAFNNKMGINVLGQKTELQKAMEKMRHQVYTKQLSEEKKNNRSDLELQLEKRAMRLREYENDMTDQSVDGGFPVSENEFHRIHAKVNGRFASATS